MNESQAPTCLNAFRRVGLRSFRKCYPQVSLWVCISAWPAPRWARCPDAGIQTTAKEFHCLFFTFINLTRFSTRKREESLCISCYTARERAFNRWPSYQGSIRFCKKYYLLHDCGQPLLHKHTPLLPSRYTEEINTGQQGNQISGTTLKVSCHFLLILSSQVLKRDVILGCGLSYISVCV